MFLYDRSVRLTLHLAGIEGVSTLILFSYLYGVGFFILLSAFRLPSPVLRAFPFHVQGGAPPVLLSVPTCFLPPRLLRLPSLLPRLPCFSPCPSYSKIPVRSPPV